MARNPEKVRPCWWTISEEGLMELLREVEAGKTPDEVYLAAYMDADHEHVCGDECEHEGEPTDE